MKNIRNIGKSRDSEGKVDINKEVKKRKVREEVYATRGGKVSTGKG